MRAERAAGSGLMGLPESTKAAPSRFCVRRFLHVASSRRRAGHLICQRSLVVALRILG